MTYRRIMAALLALLLCGAPLAGAAAGEVAGTELLEDQPAIGAEAGADELLPEAGADELLPESAEDEPEAEAGLVEDDVDVLPEFRLDLAEVPAGEPGEAAAPADGTALDVGEEAADAEASGGLTLIEEIDEGDDAAEDDDPDAAEELSEEEFTESGEGFDDSGIDGDALYEGYIDGILGVNGAPDASLAQKVNGNKLSGFRRHLYDKLRAFALQVASGSRSSTQITVSLSGASCAFTPAQLGVSARLSGGKLPAAAHSAFKARLQEDVSQAIAALLTDYPYEFYWFNRYRVTSGGYSYNYSYKYARKGSKWTKVQLTGGVAFSFRVASAYAAGTYAVNASGVRAARQAASNASAIVAAYASKSDYDKLDGYRREICNRVSYNWAAYNGSKSGAFSSTDPWQLVWVFDGDSTTNVVCEGYAKAFQYLCDLTKFRGNICSYCVTGTLNGGAHMWNVVTMDNRKKYLVDVTNSDSGMSGQNGGLFMAGCSSGSVAGGYVVNGARYVYDAETLRTYAASELALSTVGYRYDSQAAKTILANGGAPIVIGVGEKVTLRTNEGGVRFRTSNKKVAAVSGAGVVKGVKIGTATITVVASDYVTETCRVTVKKAPKKVKLSASKASLGMGQTRKLAAKLSPGGCRPGVTWSSSNPAVATVDRNGLVRPVKPGKATITARTYNGKKAKCKVTVKPLPSSVAVRVRTVLGLGETVRATAALSKGSASAIAWSVSGTAVAVDAAGSLRAVRTGSALVTATAYNGKSGTAEVRVVSAPDALALSAYSLTLKRRRSATLRVALPAGTAGACTFKSSNPKVASVSAAGRITAKKKGRTVITVRTYNGIARTCTVTVK